jgi:hypothetical protein
MRPDLSLVEELTTGTALPEVYLGAGVVLALVACGLVWLALWSRRAYLNRRRECIACLHELPGFCFESPKHDVCGQCTRFFSRRTVRG